MADKAKMQSDLKANETSISTLNNLLKSQQLKIDELAFKLKKLYDALKLAESHLDEERIAVSRYNLINQELEKDLNSLKLKLKEMRQSEAFKNKQENEETKKVRGKYLTLLEELRASDIWILKLLAYLKNGDISEAIDMILGKQKLIQIRVETTEKELQMLRADIFFGRANAFKFPSNTPYMIPQKNHKRSSSISPLRSRQQIPVDHRRMESYSKPYDLDRGLY